MAKEFLPPPRVQPFPAPHQVRVQLEHAFAFHREGQFDAAWSKYEQILTLDAANVEALHGKGLIAYQRSNIEAAVQLMRAALASDAMRADIHNNLGNVLLEAGHLEEAAASLQQALALNPQSAGVHNNLANVWRELGRNAEAESHYQRALALDGGYAEAAYNLGVLCAEQGRVEAAQHYYREALRIQPAHPQAHNNLGLLLQQQGQLQAAAACFQSAVAQTPDFAEAHNNLGAVFEDAGEWAQAVACYRRALALRPDYVEACSNLGALLHAQGKFDEAVAIYRAALVTHPQDIGLLHNLGAVLQDAKQYDAALQCYREVLAAVPEHAPTLAAWLYQAQQLCDWASMAAVETRLLAAPAAETGTIAPFTVLRTAASAARQRTLAAAYCNAEYGTLRLPAAPLRDYAARTERLRIGYMSGDFREHPVAYLTAELFELHDRSRFEIIGYSLYGNALRSELRDRIRSGCDDFVDLEALAPVAAAERIHADGVHILVDLSGYTERSRPKTLALRPAPLQINYLGYPGTMGAPFIDYLITDRFVTPLDQQPHYSEQFAYLPHCFQPNDRGKAIAEQTPSRAACGLPETGFVFCSFNRSYKITPRVFEVWMQLLTALPGSVLWLSDLEATAMENLRREAQARGVAPARLVFAARTDSMADHLARHRQADLFLDTLPYNAHTTASDALWAGLPLLTCAGETFAARVAGSLLHAVGLPELVTHSLEDYQALALKLAREPQLLAGYRRRLAENRLTCALFDSARYARDLERVYELMWEHHQHGRLPQLIEVNEVVRGAA